ncbi:DNA oxidative demethylase AlkB [Noviherbaspirillum aerium]|uniref:DNA oxidative demethylase AlkB n=1 Tax=Noviherbaspirillum aerium TaxID=2588497 RepID=UPI00124CA283|nr:DNA oxidative demethylase AlkB [Noviherbaspirillum aerium]
MNLELFDDFDTAPVTSELLCDGAMVLRRFALQDGKDLLAAVDAIAQHAAFRRMETPGGLRMSVAMTGCGAYGWISDRSGYRYDSVDPLTGLAWPRMPHLFLELARRAAAQAGFDGFEPDACLINRYEAGARLSLHQDKDERSFDHPIVSLSLGMPAVFLFGGLQRADRAMRIPLMHGDAVVWGGPARLRYHGVLPVKASPHPLAGDCRINLTFRKVT